MKSAIAVTSTSLSRSRMAQAMRQAPMSDVAAAAAFASMDRAPRSSPAHVASPAKPQRMMDRTPSTTAARRMTPLTISPAWGLPAPVRVVTW